MVKILLVLVTLTATAFAEDEDDSPAFNMFGFDISMGGLPVNGSDTFVFALGLTVEHPVFRKTRVLGEYSWMWLQRRDTRALTQAAPGDGMIVRPDDHGTGHRAALGLRRELVGRGGGSTRAFLDGELGATVALINDNMNGVTVLPGVFTGLRVGYDLYSRRDSSPSSTFEGAILLRAIALREGFGLSVGIGMFWGN